MTNKTITPVISVILLIMLTIAVSATAWYWVNGLQANLEASSAQGLEGATEMGNIQYSIVSLSCNASNASIALMGNITILLRNNGVNQIAAGEIFLIKLLSDSGVELGSYVTPLRTAIGTSGMSSIGNITFFISTPSPSWQTIMVSGTRYQIKTDVKGIVQSMYCTAAI